MRLIKDIINLYISKWKEAFVRGKNNRNNADDYWIFTKNSLKDLFNVLLLLAILIISICVLTNIFSLFITNNVIVCIMTLFPVLLFEFPIGMLWLSRVIIH